MRKKSLKSSQKFNGFNPKILLIIITCISALIFFNGWIYVHFYFKEFGVSTSAKSVNDCYIYGIKQILHTESIIGYYPIVVIFVIAVCAHLFEELYYKLPYKWQTDIKKFFNMYSILFIVFIIYVSINFTCKLSIYLAKENAQNSMSKNTNNPKVSIIIKKKYIDTIGENEVFNLRKEYYHLLRNGEKYIILFKPTKNGNKKPRIMFLKHEFIATLVIRE